MKHGLRHRTAIETAPAHGAAKAERSQHLVAHRMVLLDLVVMVPDRQRLARSIRAGRRTLPAGIDGDRRHAILAGAYYFARKRLHRAAQMWREASTHGSRNKLRAAVESWQRVVTTLEKPTRGYWGPLS